MSDFPTDSGPTEVDFPIEEPGEGYDNMDIWEEPASDEAVLPPMNTDLAEETTREVGYPDEMAEYWRYQGNTNDCAIYAQGGVLEADGQEFDVERFRQQSADGGWYTPEDGTYLNHFGDLLEENGVPVTRYEGASVQDMAGELSEGHGVVAAVDCLPLWGEPGGHALWVTGMEVGADGLPTSVTCNDSGRQDGQEIAYPYENFKQAWDLYGNTMVATQETLTTLEN